MTPKPTPICGQHKTPKEWRKTTFEYNDEGISVRVPNVDAWVCPEDGEASFTPETVDELIITVRELIETAKRAKERRSLLTEYVVAVGSNQPQSLRS
jgi:YgiT-type zinc finger domain-containing protein